MINRRTILALMGLVSLYGIDWVVGEHFPEHTSAAEENGLIPLIFSKHYDVTAFGLEKFHPFDGRKYGKVKNALVDSGLRSDEDFICPEEITKEQLLFVHSKEYLKSLKNSIRIAKILEQ